MHAIPQAPQLLESVLVLAHCPLQLVVPVGQPQVPPEQAMGEGQVTLQLPQLSGSVAGVTQLEPH